MHEQHQPMEHAHQHPMGHPHHHRHHHHIEIYHRVMPYIERAHMAHPDIGRMSPEQLHVLADRVMHDSDILRQLPPGHTEDTMRDMIQILLLTSEEAGGAVETFNPLVPLALGPWAWPYWGWGGPWFGPGRRFRHGFRGGRGGGRGRR